MSFEANHVRARSSYSNVRCDGCDAELRHGCPPPGANRGDAWDSLQPSDGLILDLSGGYGMFIDPVFATADELRVVFCAECAKRLCDAFPAFKQTVAKHISSSIGHSCPQAGGELLWTSYLTCACADETPRGR